MIDENHGNVSAVDRRRIVVFKLMIIKIVYVLMSPLAGRNLRAKNIDNIFG